MSTKMVVGLLLAASCLAAASSGVAETGNGRARIATGEVRGVVAGDAVAFKAMPYAAPPVGTLRWRAPQPPRPWRGERDASQFGPACVQTAGGSSYHGPESEDCLTLNVWAPAHHEGAGAPVMVWIHGGGFIGGTGARYDGAPFARDGVVLVTLNYRLGRLGFFAHPALAASGPDGALADFGLMDQVAALEWVKANIAAFGGNSDNVTVFGESAGAMSVNYLLISPKARGLFAKAISESGFARTPGKTLAAAQASGVSFAKSLGVDGDGADAAKALRALPAKAFTRPVPGLADADVSVPVIDGVVASETVAAAFAKGDQARTPLIVGGNSFEASLVPQLLKDPDAVLARLGSNRDRAVAFFGGGDPVKAAANLVTLSQVIEPDRYLARQDAKAGVPAFVYYFSYVPAAVRAQTIGAGHGAEVAYVFEALPKTDTQKAADDTRLGPALIPAATAADEAVSRAMHAYWVAFAKTGDPGAAGGPPWPAVSATDDTVMELGDDGPLVRQGFKTLELDILASKVAAADGGAPR